MLILLDRLGVGSVPGTIDLCDCVTREIEVGKVYLLLRRMNPTALTWWRRRWGERAVAAVEHPVGTR